LITGAVGSFRQRTDLTKDTGRIRDGERKQKEGQMFWITFSIIM